VLAVALGKRRASIQNCGWDSLRVSRLSNMVAAKRSRSGRVFQQAASF